MTKPLLMMLVGLPCSGKSTWRNMFTHAETKMMATLSTDDMVEELRREGETYSDCFKRLQENGALKNNEEMLMRAARQLAMFKQSCIWDQTNLTRKSRAKKLAIFDPNVYTRVAMVFPTNFQIIKIRNETRFKETGKFIPEKVLYDMLRQFQAPTYWFDEGFDYIYEVR